ncbi:MAG TPA: YtxH domain-containing protein [Polyangiaceae bacterium]|nr:YtxH domain-containing protein [Polyangiaceae bacterium]
MNFAKLALAIGSTIGARQAVRAVQTYGVADLLNTVGLERRRTTMDRLLPALGLIGLGTAIGAGVALLWAPSSGRELRAKVSEQIDNAKDRAKERLDNGMRSLEDTMPNRAGA